MTEIHNAELTEEIITGAVAAWLEQTNDSAMSIEVGFQRDVSHTSNFDLIAATKIDVLKADDFRPMKRGEHVWLEDDQKMINELPKGKRSYEAKRAQAAKSKGIIHNLRKAIANWTEKEAGDGKRGDGKSPARSPGGKMLVPKKKWTDEVVKRVAVKMELPTAEYYPVRFTQGVRRQLILRKSATELATAQEAPAVREKGEAQDRTDQDCWTLPTDLSSSRESLASEAPTQKEESSPPSSPEKEKEKPKEKPPSPMTPTPIVKEEKKVENAPPPPPPPPVVEKEKKEEPKQEKPVEKVVEPKVEEVAKKEEPVVKKEEKPEVVEKKEEPPVVVPDKKRSKKNSQINFKRHPDSGQLTILSEQDGVVTFSCSTKHRVKKTSHS
uniref:Uncharacterized protein n=1 Tax=Caenorhabditis japonica TaxID=281687 RepID=A0A8R1HP87_CAEJA